MPPHAHSKIDVWSVEGRFQYLIYSPQGTVEGLLLDTDGIPTQYVIESHDIDAQMLFERLCVGQVLVLEGTEAAPSPHGQGAHTVYHLERVARIDGREREPRRTHGKAEGRVVRFNYARHGEPNGVLLDNGDFVHTKPGGFSSLGLRVGDQVTAEGQSRLLSTGHGRVIEATRVNGLALEAWL